MSDASEIHALNETWQEWTGHLSWEDIEGDPRELVHSGFLRGWTAGRDCERARLTPDWIAALERARDMRDDEIEQLEVILAAEREKTARLTEALEWYADPANHDRGPNLMPHPTLTMTDRGARARAALAAPAATSSGATAAP